MIDRMFSGWFKPLLNHGTFLTKKSCTGYCLIKSKQNQGYAPSTVFSPCDKVSANKNSLTQINCSIQSSLFNFLFNIFCLKKYFFIKSDSLLANLIYKYFNIHLFHLSLAWTIIFSFIFVLICIFIQLNSNLLLRRFK